MLGRPSESVNKRAENVLRMRYGLKRAVGSEQWVVVSDRRGWDCRAGGSVLKCFHARSHQTLDFRGTVGIAAADSFGGRIDGTAAAGGAIETSGSQPGGGGCAHSAGRPAGTHHRAS